MKAPATEYVTLVEVLELTRPFEEFADAIEAAARRLEAEGVQELVALHFYGSPESTEAGAMIAKNKAGSVPEDSGSIRPATGDPVGLLYGADSVRFRSHSRTYLSQAVRVVVLLFSTKSVRTLLVTGGRTMLSDVSA
jgi:hypothetical protein